MHLKKPSAKWQPFCVGLIVTSCQSASLPVLSFCPVCSLTRTCINSLAPEKLLCHFKTAIFNLVLLIGFFTSSKDNALRWMPRDLTDDKSTLVQVMAWCRQATSHYLSQCWPSSMSPYGITRPQWVNSSPPGQNGRHFAGNIFRCIFVNEKFCILIQISLKFVPKWQYVSIGLGNGLAPNRRQAITWTNDDLVHWCIYVALGGDELTHCSLGDLDEISEMWFSLLTYSLVC